ncbi:MAG: CHAD domain-containing protein [Rhodospirillaceae bacterium]|nr:CHAD domain-containing protein [Rhodospirillales bacterium]
MDGKEIELKLAVPPEALGSLKRHPAVKDHQQGKPAAKRLRSVYYDTPDMTLSKAGITARLRVSGDSRVQTVKTSGSRTSGLFSRNEWEAPVNGDGLDGAGLRATGLAPLQDEAVINALAPVFSTEIHRHIHRLGGTDWQVELALDQGEIVAGAKREAVCEVELELVQGPPSRLFALARQMTESVPARLLTLSKSDRGYDLAAGREAAPVKSKPVALEVDTTIADAFRLIARNCLHHLLANEPSLTAHGHGEAVHQMRVALRRLRSALKVFRPVVEGDELARIKAEIKWLLAVLSPARDTEVFLSEIITPVTEHHPGDAELRALHDYWEARRSHDLTAAQAAVTERRFTGLLLDLGAWVEAGDWCSDPALAESRHLDDPVAPFARKILDKQARRMGKAACKKLSKLAPAHLHEVRILGKQLRYGGEFFSPLYGKQAKDFLSALAGLQDVLGEINDIAMAGPRLESSHHASEQASRMVAQWHEARRPHLLAEADKAWKELRKEKRFWRG